MTHKQLIGILAIAIAGAGFAARPAQAQLGGGVPDLSEFAGAISASIADGDAPVSKTPGGKFSSGLVVPSVKPGAAAQGIGKQLRDALDKNGKKPENAAIETEMPTTLKNIEAGLEKVGFAKRDMGVALGYAFLYNYETATGKKVPEAASATAAKTVAAAFAKHWDAKYKTMKPEAKEKIYESLLVSTTLFAAFSEQFEKAGKTQDATSIRKSAGMLFEKLIGVPPAQVTIDDAGKITGLAGGKAQ
ncbi:MAG: hypothetical protein H7Y38_08685 [Armatimonadetes bacterium]|nr:hypothetical protein [Armatimonadota bacterium]